MIHKYSFFLLITVLLLLTGCDSSPPTKVPSLDMPLMAEAIRFIGVCGVVCSLIWGASIVISSMQRKD